MELAVEPKTSRTSKQPAPERTFDHIVQRPDENDLWYARFLRYVALGPGRSVSLVATGRRNAYPVPAHWPIQAKQHDWRIRAEAFDQEVKKDPDLIPTLGLLIAKMRLSAPNGEAEKLMGIKYQPPPHNEDDEDEQTGT